MPVRPYIPTTTGAHKLDLDRKTVKKLVDADMIRASGSSLLAADVDRLAAQRASRTYVTKLENITGTIGFAVPVSNPELGSSMYFAPGSDNWTEAHNGVLSQGLTPHTDDKFTGWWNIKDDILDRLIAERSVMLSTVGGFVKEAAQIVGLATTSDYRRLRALVVRELDVEQYRGFIPDSSQKGGYFQL